MSLKLSLDLPCATSRGGGSAAEGMESLPPATRQFFIPATQITETPLVGLRRVQTAYKFYLSTVCASNPTYI